MYFSEPLTDFRAQLFTDDDGQSIDLDFNVDSGVWRVTVDEAVSTNTLAQMVRFLHEQFYVGEEDYLRDWLTVVESVKRGKSTVYRLQTVDRL